MNSLQNADYAEEQRGGRAGEQRNGEAREQGGRYESSPLPHRTPAPLPRQQMSTAGQDTPPATDTFAWQDTLWREWRNTDDEEYAGHLFELIGDTPAGRVATLINVALGILYGGLAGLLLSVLSVLNSSIGGVLSGLLWVGLGSMLGGTIAFLFRRFEAKMTWQSWLARLTFNIAPNEMGLVVVALIIALFGGQIGWMMSWSAGLGHGIGIISLVIFLSVILGARMIGWLIGLTRKPNPGHLHRYRNLWFWWRKPPHGFEVESALREAGRVSTATDSEWLELLQHLARRKTEPLDWETLTTQLQSRYWEERFIATQLLAVSGGEGVAVLAPIANRITSPQHKTAIRLLHGISQETTTHLAHRAERLLCPGCLAFFDALHITIADNSVITYYGCRLCGQSLKFWEGEIIAALDAEMGNEPLVEDGVVRINWLTRRELFDFHSVEITQAGDEDVERFAVQVGNDTDPTRQARYRRMRCVVNPACQLSENTLRILGRIFGEVESR